MSSGEHPLPPADPPSPIPSDPLKLPYALGPYRLLRRIGEGGMGEVFEASDERLGRRVAIKRIHQQAGSDSDRRRRFQQEARTAASLNHSGLVQIYDILEQGNLDFLVLELVEGRSLRQRLAAGPLSRAELLHLSRELAESLDHAHQRGIVHRDLKAENILLTAEGRSKIADFGIAKQSGSRTETLTQNGALVGTYQGMSPEQARGELVDHRSDLFSLGLLLYEAATGSNPFLDKNPLATLRRIVREEEPPLASLRPDLPEAYCELIHRLLAKPRELRPQSAREVLRQLRETPGETKTAETFLNGPSDTTKSLHRLYDLPGEELQKPRDRTYGLLWGLAAVSLLIVLALLRQALGSSPSATVEPLVVAVPTPSGPDIGSLPSAQAELMPSAIRHTLIHGLLSFQGVLVPATSEVDSAGSQAKQIARITGADEILDARVQCQTLRCFVTLSRLADGGQRTAWTERIEAPVDDVYLLSQAVLGVLRRGYSELAPRTAAPVLEVRPQDYEEYLGLHRSFREGFSALPRDQTLTRLAAMRDTSPNFLDSFLLAAEIQRLSFIETRDPETLDEALGLVAASRNLAPEHPRPLHLLFRTALAGARFELAEEALTELARIDPGTSDLSAFKALLLEARGRELEALREARKAAARVPSRRNLSNLANLEFKVGDVDGSRESLLQAMALAPEDFTLKSQLAMVELMAGDAQRAEELYRELVDRNPGFGELSNLGLALLLLERYEEARRHFQEALAKAPRNIFAMLNLADARLLAGDQASADELYQLLLETLDQDPAAAGWQFLTVRGQALARLGRFKEAVAAVLEAQRLAPNIAQVAFESALVYTLAGDATSALVQAERALDLGYETRWFQFPWFGDLWDDPVLGERLLAGNQKAPPEAGSLSEER